MNKNINIIEFNNVSKRYGKNFAVKDLSFAVPKGKVTALIGKNGAGKTTSMKIITGMVKNYSGEVIWNFNKNKKFVNTHIGFAPEKLEFYGIQTVDEFLNTIAKSRKVSKNYYKKYIAEMLQLFDMEKYQNKNVSSLSKGNLQKLVFIQAFIHSPDLIVLDEPTSGIDPIAKKCMFDYIVKYKNEGKSIIISSHRLDELQRLCDYVVLIDSGTAIKSTSIKNILTERETLEDFFIESISEKNTTIKEVQE